MLHKKLFVISDSPEVGSIFAGALKDFSGVEITWLDSFFPAGKILEQSSATPFATRPEVIVIDPATADFQEPHIRQRFARFSKDLTILAILTETMKREEVLNQLGRIAPFDVLRAPLEAVDIPFPAATFHGRRRCLSPFGQHRREFFPGSRRGSR